MASMLPFLFAAVVMAAVGYAAARAHERKRRRAKELAARYGFLVDLGPKDPPPLRFDLFDVGRSKQVRHQFWRPGEQHSVFDYQYTTGSGKNSTTHHHTCALVPLPFAAPHTEIGPEGFWSGIGRALGLRDIEVESQRFNDRYRVTGDDERFAVTMLDPPTIAWFLEHEPVVGGLKLEFWGPWLLCISDRLDLDRHFGYLDWAASIPAALPAVLPSLYPIR